MANPIIYEVNIEIDQGVSSDYLVWLKEHILEILQIEGFLQAKVYSLEVENSQRDHFCVHYFLKDQVSLDRYLLQHAPRLRQEAVEKFGDRFKAHRRVLTPLQGELGSVEGVP